ncbi:MAG: UDP-glucose 4-epimerase GalE [Chlorobi bacterium]|nr:UDP-glucose 4-epimerase GalE [Chlorobiota bacterium]
MKIIITGGAGYIGSHTIVELSNAGYDIVCFDSMERADPEIWRRTLELSNKPVTLEKIDLTNLELVREAISKHKDAVAVMHFAAFKSSPESVKNPMLYFHNNVTSLINILKALESTSNNINMFLFSSSCSVYGDADELPVTENAPFKEAKSPYARTKQISELILKDVSMYSKKLHTVSLRYFNPVGAHKSYKIGEPLVGEPENLFPRIMLAITGRLPAFTIYGSDYPTHDGTPIRDYIHILDLARAHVLALQWMLKQKPTYEVFNLGSGTGLSVLQVIKAFEKYIGVKVPYSIGSRRPGDVAEIYASFDKARRILGWEPKLLVKDMVIDTWKWYLHMENNTYFRKKLDSKFPRDYPSSFPLNYPK